MKQLLQGIGFILIVIGGFWVGMQWGAITPTGAPNRPAPIVPVVPVAPTPETPTTPAATVSTDVVTPVVDTPVVIVAT